MPFSVSIPAHDQGQPVVLDFSYRQLGGETAGGSPDPIVIDGYDWIGPDSVVDHGTYRTSRTTLASISTAFELEISLSSFEPDNLAYVEIYSVVVTYTPLVKGSWPLRQRQSLTGAPSWPLRQRQNGGHSGSWPLRQRQRGV